jgi:hypothetical protein
VRLFLLNGQPAGEIRDPEFARLFFGIWLSPRTSEPAMRRALLAGRGRPVTGWPPSPGATAWRYGLLGLPLAFVALPLYVVLPNHYAREFGVPLATLGAVLLGARLFDAFIDPLIGRGADRLFARSIRAVLRAGRRWRRWCWPPGLRCCFSRPPAPGAGACGPRRCWC